MGQNKKEASREFTVEDFIARSGAGESSLERYTYLLTLMKRWVGKPLCEVSERDLIVLKKKLRGMPSGPQLATLLRQFYKAAGREDLRELCKIKQRFHRLSPQDILTLPEIQSMVDAAESLRDKCFISLLWETGVRVHELLALNLGDIREMDSPENNGKKFYVVWFRKVKIPGEEHRSFVIEAAPILSAWIKAYPQAKQSDSPLFPAWSGKRLGRDGGGRIVERTARKAKIGKRVYCHLLRHSRATHLLRLGVAEIQVARLLGWKNTQMLQRYAHLVNEDDYAALLRANGIEPPKPRDLGKLTFMEDRLKPIVPMVPPPGSQRPQEDSTVQVAELLKRIDGLEQTVAEAKHLWEQAKPRIDEANAAFERMKKLTNLDK